MSTCRDCGARITWARSADGARWLRPFEARYTAVLPDEDETVVSMINGEWQEVNVRQFRMYKRHLCPMEDGEQIGVGKTIVVDEEQERIWAEEEARENEERRLRDLERVIRRYAPHQLRVDCPECYSTAGEPCNNGTFAGRPNYVTTPCRARNLVTAFEDDQPWPPRHNQRGYKAMRQWLSQNANIFEEPALKV